MEKSFQYGGADSLEEALDARLSLAGGGKKLFDCPNSWLFGVLINVHRKEQGLL